MNWPEHLRVLHRLTGAHQFEFTHGVTVFINSNDTFSMRRGYVNTHYSIISSDELQVHLEPLQLTGTYT